MIGVTATLLLSGCSSRPESPFTAHASLADRTLGSGISTGVLVEPNDGSRPVARALDHAATSVFMEAYILTDRSIVRALERAASQSVRVHVLLDPRAIGMGRQPETVAARLRAAGVSVRWSNPAFPLTHAKTLLIDDRRALISTANFSKAGFSADRDFMLWDSNPRDVYELSALLRDDWDRLPGAIDAPNLVIAPASARAKLEALIIRARTSIRVYGEEMRDVRFERLLSDRACNGVDVRIILPAAPTDGSPIYRGRCARLRILNHPYVHAKAIVIDNRYGYLGSENMSSQSLDRNREVGVLVQQRPARRIAAVFARDWGHALPVRGTGR